MLCGLAGQSSVPRRSYTMGFSPGRAVERMTWEEGFSPSDDCSSPTEGSRLCHFALTEAQPSDLASVEIQTPKAAIEAIGGCRPRKPGRALVNRARTVPGCDATALHVQLVVHWRQFAPGPVSDLVVELRGGLGKKKGKSSTLGSRHILPMGWGILLIQWRTGFKG